jgi:hypothetical protein
LVAVVTTPPPFLNALDLWERTLRSGHVFGESSVKRHSKTRPDLSPPLGLRHCLLGSLEQGVKMGTHQEQAWEGQGSQSGRHTPQGLHLSVFLVIPSAWAGKGES